MKNISILGSTGSIGTQTIDVLQSIDANVIAITTNKNIELLEKQARKFKVKLAVAYDEEAAKKLAKNLSDTEIKVMSGIQGLIAAATINEIDIVVTAVVGMIGLIPTIKAIEAKKDIALANKETLVCAGQIVIQKAKENGVKILPVDSEHSAIFQSLQGANGNRFKKILLTASGGPFFGFSKEQIKKVTKEDALKHPNWNMGAKITIDSATMINKGLEFIEAMWLYDADVTQIEVLVHRESIIHSMVEYEDNSIIAQLGVPDMRIPIQYALTYPKRLPCKAEQLDFKKMSKMSFFEPDLNVFKGIALAQRAAKIKGNAGAVLNGANEAAVDLFLKGKIKFYQISDIVEKALDTVPFSEIRTVDDVIKSDKEAREIVYNIVL